MGRDRMDKSESGVPTIAIFVQKKTRNYCRCNKSVPYYYRSYAEHFLVLVVRMKMVMKSLSKFYIFCQTLVKTFYLSTFFTFFGSNLWGKLLNTIVASFKIKICTRLQISILSNTRSSDMTGKVTNILQGCFKIFK